LTLPTLFAILLWQALRGESFAAPGVTTMTVLSVWAAATFAGLLMPLLAHSPVRQRYAVSAKRA
jgi:hypothetical protein